MPRSKGVRWSLLLVSLAVALMVVVTGCAQKATPTPAPATTPKPAATPAATPPPVQKTVWKIPGNLPLGYYNQAPWKELFVEINANSGGRLEIQYFAGGELGYKGDESLRLIRDGIVQAAEVVGPWVGGDFPILDGTTLPFLLQTTEDSKKAAAATRAAIDKEMSAKFKGKVLAANGPGAIHVYSKKPVVKVEDFKGLKVRTYGAVGSLGLQALEAAPITIIAGEVYTSLQRGVADAAAASHSATFGWKLQEVLKYIDMWYIANTFASPMLVVNIDAWNALPSDLQKLVADTSAKMEEKAWAAAVTADEAALKGLTGAGMQVVEVSEAERNRAAKLSLPVWEEWAKGQGPAAQEFLAAARKAVGR